MSRLLHLGKPLTSALRRRESLRQSRPKNEPGAARVATQRGKAFAEDYPQSQRYFIYRGEERLLIDGVLCLPCAEFLRALRPDIGFRY
jgi:hypothetical protein